MKVETMTAMPEHKSSVSINIVKGKLKPKGLNYVDTGDTCTVVIVGKVTTTSDMDNTVSLSIEPDTIRFREQKKEDDDQDEKDYPEGESLSGEMKNMTQKRTWRPGRE